MRQAWCSDPKCDGGARVGRDCPPAWLTCVFCGAPLTFVEPRKTEMQRQSKAGGSDG